MGKLSSILTVAKSTPAKKIIVNIYTTPKLDNLDYYLNPFMHNVVKWSNII